MRWISIFAFVVLSATSVAATSAPSGSGPAPASPSTTDPSVEPVDEDGQCKRGRIQCFNAGSCEKIGDQCYNCTDTYEYSSAMGQCYRCPQNTGLAKRGSSWICQ